MPRKPRVAVCIGAFEYGGQGTVVDHELIYLRDRFALTLIAEKVLKPVPEGVTCREMSAWGTVPAINQELVAYFRTFDLVHCHDSLGMMRAARASGNRFVITSHGIAPIKLRYGARSKIEGLITLAAYPSLYRSAGAVVAISRYIADWLETFAGVKAHLISNGVAQVIDPPLEPPLARNLLFVGEISQRKGIPDLIYGISSTAQDVTLDLVGQGSADPYTAQVSGLGLQDRIRFHGVLDKASLASAYSSAFCTCTASHWEGFGLPVLEGFGFGRPAIVRAQGGQLELVQQADAGSAFRRPDELGTCVDAVTKDWLRLSHNAIKFAKQHTWPEAFRQYAELFESLI